jgi:hypothetical protein
MLLSLSLSVSLMFVAILGWMGYLHHGDNSDDENRQSSL